LPTQYRILEAGNTVDGIKQAQKSLRKRFISNPKKEDDSGSYNSSHWPRERLSKRNHELIRLLLLHLRLLIITIDRLPLTERSPCELDHLFVTVSNQPNPVNHFGQKTSGIAASRESKHVDVVSWRVVLHQEFIPANHMVVERSTNGTVFSLDVPILQLCDSSGSAQTCGRNICANSRLIVVETFSRRAIKHPEDLEDVTVTGVPVEFIACARVSQRCIPLKTISSPVPSKQSTSVLRGFRSVAPRCEGP
jgi:hypothetical protein